MKFYQNFRKSDPELELATYYLFWKAKINQLSVARIIWKIRWDSNITKKYIIGEKLLWILCHFTLFVSSMLKWFCKQILLKNFKRVQGYLPTYPYFHHVALRNLQRLSLHHHLDIYQPILDKGLNTLLKNMNNFVHKLTIP